ncbi:nickel ABC transporter, permease subunit NikB [Desulfofarcimen acetoxidans DSM 771]|uniref:Nickel import system permease protein NikB n=1 Tax=Desulfofarcimen acetoxidans (strain ATCC 49208 / DSM 771 / KCTC 5769 / VKM B-1644 / 5575) TaxID=485916 RepID=C8W4V1_DESAS|nr:nickel ABC transporter permease subunit NikB [Desulfofarcimen acetoxidans]ACV61303.1 nickel ABC transporter, permease subunit NikB [Desulfofarcimen acetoxidans DSM 771]
MKKYIFRRLLNIIPVLLGISVITFGLIHMVPCDPAEVYLRLSQIPPTDEAVALVRSELGLDRPLYIQYFDWLWKVFHLDFGKSFVTRQPVLPSVLYYIPATIQLTACSLLLMFLISIPLGIWAALYKDSLLDQFSRILAFIGASMPSFWLGFLLLYVFSLKLDLLPVTGRGTFLHLILPSLTLALGYAATYTRLLRTSMLENLNKDFVLYARVRGIKEKLIIGKHVFKNALLPMITAFGMSLGHLLAGSVIVENIFAWPGVGRYCVFSIFSRDYPVIQCYVCLMAVIFVVCNLLVDIAYVYLDPRIKIGR